MEISPLCTTSGGGTVGSGQGGTDMLPMKSLHHVLPVVVVQLVDKVVQV